jgi:hypothetical protein
LGCWRFNAPNGPKIRIRQLLRGTQAGEPKIYCKKTLLLSHLKGADKGRTKRRFELGKSRQQQMQARTAISKTRSTNGIRAG